MPQHYQTSSSHPAIASITGHNDGHDRSVLGAALSLSPAPLTPLASVLLGVTGPAKVVALEMPWLLAVLGWCPEPTFDAGAGAVVGAVVGTTAAALFGAAAGPEPAAGAACKSGMRHTAPEAPALGQRLPQSACLWGSDELKYART